MKHAILLTLLLCGFFAYSQNPATDPLPKILPPPPEAAALQRYTQTDVNLSKGEPQIIIPLYTLHAGKISLPLTLRYNAGGLRTAELAGACGLGWMLAGGGAITVSLRGRSDLAQAYRSTPDIRNFNPDYFLNPAHYNQALNLIQYNLDTEPDIFSFNAPGISGRFMFDDSLQHIYCLPAQKITIERLNGLNGFLMTEPGGTKYWFTAAESQSPHEVCTIGQANPRELSGSLAAAWWLTKIVHPAGDSVVLEYESYTSQYREGRSETRYKYLPTSNCGPYTNAMSSSERACTRTITLNGKRLKKIIAPALGELELYYTTPREDLDYHSANAQARRLDSLVVRSGSTRLRKISFQYNYFTSPGKTSAPAADSFLYKRLKLESLTDEGAGTYRFVYDENRQLPMRLSNAQDLNGFYNGGAGSPTGPMIPCGFGYANCADRSTDPQAMSAWTLNAIYYPTGGRSRFNWEAHRSTSRQTIYDSLWQGFGLEAEPQEVKIDSFMLGNSTYNWLRVQWSLPRSNNNLEGQSTGFITQPNGVRIRLDSIGVSGSLLLNRQAGRYKININSYHQFVATANINLIWLDSVSVSQSLQTQYHSGLRIRSISDSAGFDAPEMRRFYTYFNPADSLEYFTDQRSLQPVSQVEQYHCDPQSTQNNFTCRYLQYNAQGVTAFGAENDRQFGYRFAAIHYDTVGSGKKGREDFEFATQQADIDSLGTYTADAFFGQLLNKKQWRYLPATQQFMLAQEEQNRYTYLVDEGDFWGENNPPRFSTRNQHFVAGLQLKVLIPESNNPCGAGIGYSPYIFEAASYLKTSFQQYPQQSRIKIYPVGTPLQELKQWTFYDNPAHLLPTRSQSLNTSGDTLETLTRYNSDFQLFQNADSANAGLTELSRRKIFALPVEKISILKKTDGSVWVTGASLITYHPGLPVPEKIYTLDVEAPLPFNQFQLANNTQNGFMKDSRYRGQLSFSAYDGRGNILQQQKTGDLPQSYIWGYGRQYPIAQITGAAQNGVAFTSFEEDASGNWIFPESGKTFNTFFTGKTGYNLGNGSISSASLPQAPYIVSYWSHTGPALVNGSGPQRSWAGSPGWTYYEHELTGNAISISGSSTIDELRLYPRGATMVSFTWLPLTGMSSQADGERNVVFYHYDAQGRLATIMDREGKMLKRFNYILSTLQNQ